MITQLKVKSVIFDMDGVITNTMPDHYKAWKIVLAQEGVHVVHLDIYSREGQRGIHSVRELFQKYGKELKPGQAEKILLRKEKLFKKMVHQRFILGARTFLKDLHRKNFKLALVTGTSRHEMHRILPDYLIKLFTVIITGNDVIHGKPHPEPYLKAIKMLNLKKSEAVVIENAPFGIASAKDAGLKCVGIETSLPKEHLKRADIIVHSFQDLNRKVRFVYGY